MNFLVSKTRSSACQYFSGTLVFSPSKYPSSNHPLVCSPQGKAAEESGFNYNNLRLVTADLFAAGSETTSTTLRWAILYMLLHPEIQRKSEDRQRCGVFPPTLIFLRGNFSSWFGVLAMRSSFGDCWSSRNQEKHLPNMAVLAGTGGGGEALIKRLELEGQVCSHLHFEGYLGTSSGQSTLFPVFGIDANLLIL